jgi:hypothetical protein
MGRAFLRLVWTRLSLGGWRGAAKLGFFVLILAALPQARALLTAGLLGGIVIGAALILARHPIAPSGPRRGTPIVLFPRTFDATTPSA